jgi:adenylate kinase family enzyme
MKKIVITGSGGSGKSMLARKLGNKRDIPVYHLDALLWHPNWVMTTREEQIEIQRKLVQGERWIIDGNYSATLSIRLQTADTIIFLDMPRWLCLWCALKRVGLYYHRTRPDMAPNCPERFDRSFLKWIWEYPKEKKPQILMKLHTLQKGKKVIILKSPKQAAAFLKEMS